MSKVITSPIERFKGTVTISDLLTFPQAHLIEAGMKHVKGEDGRVWFSDMDDNQLPAIFACVEKWEIPNLPENLTIKNFPASPRLPTHDFIEWLYGEIKKVYFGEAEIPNASSPTPSDTPAKDDIPPK